MITEYVNITQRMFSGWFWISNIEPRNTRNRMIITRDPKVRKIYFDTLIFVREIA